MMKASFEVRVVLSLLLFVSLLSCVGQQSGPPIQTSGSGKLYVTNFGNGSLITYGNAATANGNQAPSGSVQNLNVQDFLLSPAAIFVDTVNDQLYVANTGLNQILVYNNASTVTGNAIPNRV